MYTSFLRPLLFATTDPEAIHHLALAMLAHTPLAKICTVGRDFPGDPVEVFGIKFGNRLGLAAGLAKDAAALQAWKPLGCGFVELGTVTHHAQPGNPVPRLFRIPEKKALINRLGFPNEGANVIAHRLKRLQMPAPERPFAIGVNIGKSKVTPLDEAPADYLYSFTTLYERGDFFIVNVSSPNTPGLRSLQEPKQLSAILSTLQEYNDAHQKKPLLVKISPDLTKEAIDQVLEVIEQHHLSGIVATNTTIDHSSVELEETGGLSGHPLAKRSTEIIRHIHKSTSGKLPIIGVGGVFTKDDMKEKLDGGASLVEIYTSFIYQGPLIAHQFFDKMGRT